MGTSGENTPSVDHLSLHGLWQVRFPPRRSAACRPSSRSGSAAASRPGNTRGHARRAPPLRLTVREERRDSSVNLHDAKRLSALRQKNTPAEAGYLNCSRGGFGKRCKGLSSRDCKGEYLSQDWRLAEDFRNPCLPTPATLCHLEGCAQCETVGASQADIDVEAAILVQGRVPPDIHRYQGWRAGLDHRRLWTGLLWTPHKVSPARRDPSGGICIFTAERKEHGENACQPWDLVHCRLPEIGRRGTTPHPVAEV